MANPTIDFISLCPDVLRAGACILAHRNAGVVAMEKGDRSPVTAADRDAEEILLPALGRIAPDVPVVAEEQAPAGRMPAALGERFFLVYPLDGTKEFIRGGTDFTVNVALVDPRAGPTMEWDTAAGDAVLRAAGARTLCLDGAMFRYRKPGFRNAGFVATGCFEPIPLRPFMAKAAA